jgi:ATP-dependent DNA helicase RecG
VASRDTARLVDAFARPLFAAARDGFAGMGEIADLGARLREGCDRLIAAGVPPERMGPLSTWRRGLDRFERMGRDQKEIEIARGLRLAIALGATPVSAPPINRPAATAAPRSPLDADVRTIAGIGPKLAERLAERGIETIEDLAWLVPRRYDDLRTITPLEEVLAGEPPDGERATLAGTVRRVKYSAWRRRFLVVELGDEGAWLTIRWFNVDGGMARRFVVGRRVAVSGPIRARGGRAEMANPDLLGDPDDEGTAARQVIRPRYADVEGVAPAILRKAARDAIARAAPHLLDGVPADVARRLGIPALAESLRSLHAPPQTMSADEVASLNRGESEWHRRLAFDELFVLAIAVARRRAERRAHEAAPCVVDDAIVDRAIGVLPFAPTGAQRRTIDEIRRDLAEPRPMNRLLQGDVGSGKTAVAFVASAIASASGRQVAIMAPTEILAEQHATNLEPWVRSLGRRLALLTASTPRGVRESTLQMLAAGAIDVVVGTHALLAERVGFNDLGLVVIDEQHRFGVAQRVRLRSKGDEIGLPHLLVMTATPIPRTLALTFYGDLDVSVLDELPPGRTPPGTRVVSGAKGREQAYRLLRRELERGARAFVVCPLVEPSEIDPDEDDDLPWADATTTAERLVRELAPHRVGLVHGRMPRIDREATMQRLRRGEVDVLCATTVIEVGVDVPEATVMLVEDADRFGLAQLHQLRGRVGRGGGASHCLLLTRGGKTAEATRRLDVLAETCDGFRIAEEDLAIRGPGEVLGMRQAGLPKLRFGDVVRHAALAHDARREADRILTEDPRLERDEHRNLARVLETRASTASAVGAESG